MRPHRALYTDLLQPLLHHLHLRRGFLLEPGDDLLLLGDGRLELLDCRGASFDVLHQRGDGPALRPAPRAVVGGPGPRGLERPSNVAQLQQQVLVRHVAQSASAPGGPGTLGARAYTRPLLSLT